MIFFNSQDLVQCWNSWSQTNFRDEPSQGCKVNEKEQKQTQAPEFSERSRFRLILKKWIDQ